MLRSLLFQSADTDIMRSNGKIYVVMAVTTVIVLGILIYLIVLDRKVSRLESHELPESKEPLK